ncbi:hypothetical protein [Myxococcus sp. AB036A]|uniref:hypothetical protein n=1 Tax=Myxococcus sp. AB036A TaxID=2562793 RepID=UPI00129C8D42|nr:hypothetical protein [Myxococcus sp. AB036A]
MVVVKAPKYPEAMNSGQEDLTTSPPGRRFDGPRCTKGVGFYREALEEDDVARTGH